MTDVLSKVFKNECGHTGHCTVNALIQIYKYFISNAKYYAPLLAIQLLTKLNKMSPEVFKDALSYYLECTIAGFSIGWSIQTLVCIFRYILGEFKSYTFVYLPSLIGGLNILWCFPRSQRLFLITIIQSTLESILLRRRNVFTRFICDSVFLQTLIFMSCSALILHAEQIGSYKGFWLLKANKTAVKGKTDEFVNAEIVDAEKKVCIHEEKNCYTFMAKGVRNYFVFGLMLDMLKNLLGKSPVNAVGIFQKLRNFKINSTAFLASYIGIYRFTHCFLNRQSNANLQYNHQLASFLSGICYLFMPNITLLSYGIISSIQILYELIDRKSEVEKKNCTIWQFIRQVPLAKIMFPFCLAHLIHNYCLYENSVSNLSAVIIDSHTDYYASRVFARIQDYRKGLQSNI